MVAFCDWLQTEGGAACSQDILRDRLLFFVMSFSKRLANEHKETFPILDAERKKRTDGASSSQPDRTSLLATEWGDHKGHVESPKSRTTSLST